MFQVFSGVTADEVWLKAASALVTSGAARPQSSRGGPTHDIGHVAITILDPRQRWVTSRSPAINPAFAIAEVVWILNGRDDAAFLNYFNRQLPRFAGSGARYGGAYGRRLREHRGIDQLERAYCALSNTPTSRQVVLQIWDSCIDLPSDAGVPASPDVPCNIVSLLKVRDGALEWTQVMRSNDIFRGLPHNFVQFTTLHEVMAGWLGVNLGHFHYVTDSLHVYQSDVRFVEVSHPVNSFENVDVLSMAKEASDDAFCQLANAIQLIIDDDISPSRLIDMADSATLPQAFCNLLDVLVAEGLRRRQQLKLAERVMSRCTNPVFNQLWVGWLDRVSQNRAPLLGEPNASSQH
jgi:thymidylate synthase